MQVSPVDIQAWASETGAAYPSTPAEKAAVLPAVAAWKAEQLADARAARSNNAINPLAVGVGAAGLGLAGLIAFNHFRKQGLSEPAAAAMAKQAEQPVVQAGVEPEIPLPIDQQSYSPATGTRIAIKQDADPATGQRRELLKGSSTGRIVDYAALSGANRSGTLQARSRGEYNLKSLWNDPDLGPRMAAADTPELRQALLRQLSAVNPKLAEQAADAMADRLNGMTPVTEIKDASKLPPAGAVADGTLYKLRDTSETLVSNGSKWESASVAGVRARMAPTGKAAYGTTTAEEEAQAGSSMQQSRRTGGKMFQPGYLPDKLLIDDQGALLADPENGPYRLENAQLRQLAEQRLAEQREKAAAQLDADGMYEQAAALRAKGGRIGETNTAVVAPAPTSGPKLLRDADGMVITDKSGAPIAMFRQVLPDGKTVVERPGNNLLPGIKATPITVVENAVAPDHTGGTGPLQAFSDREDALTRGMLEALPASRTSRSGREGFDVTPGHLSNGPGSTYWGDPATGEPVHLLPRKGKPSLVEGMFVETQKLAFVPDPSGKSRTVWDPATESYRQQPLGQYEPVLDDSGQPVYERRPATVQDLIEYTPGNDTYDAPIYKGKTTQEMLGANDSAHYDYTRALDSSGSAGSYTALLDDGTVGRIERAAVFQPGFILKEPKDAYSRALAAAEELDTLGGMPANVYARYGVDQALIDQAKAHVEGNWSPADPRTSLAIGLQAKPVGGHTNKDWLTQVLSGMAVTPRPDAWALETLQKGATREESAALAKGWLNANPGIAEVLSSNLDGVPIVEQLNLVQEALGNAAVDFPKAVAWAEQAEPELAARAKLGGSGSFGFDQFSKSYVRKAILGAVAELKSGGGDSAANVVIPAAASELLALEARIVNPENPDMARVINRRTAGAKSPIEALWKLDGIISDAASSNLNEGYSNGSRLAEGFFTAAQPGDGSQVGALKARLGTRVNAGYPSIDAQGRPVPPTPGESMASQTPIAIRFGSNLAGAEGGLMNTSDSKTPLEVLNRAVHGEGVRVSSDPSVVDPAFKGAGRQSRLSHLAQKTGGKTRPFAVNKTLDNEVKALFGQRNDARDRFRNNEITLEQFKQIDAGVTAQVEEIIGRQQLLDQTRVGNEALLMNGNREVRTSDGQLGRGYVFDYDSTGRVQAMPDLAGDTVSYEQVFERPINESDESFDRATLEDSRIAEGQSEPERFPVAMDAPAKDPYDAFARMGDAEAEPILQRLRDSQQQLHSAQAARSRMDDQLLELRTGQPAPSRGQRSYAVPAAAIEQLNTLSASLGRPVQATSDQERGDARARHIGDYISSAATREFDARGRQIRGWTGGDSHRGGARLAGRANDNVGAYVPPSDAMVDRLVATARSRRGI